jgi:hypothetical protein
MERRSGHPALGDLHGDAGKLRATIGPADGGLCRSMRSAVGMAVQLSPSRSELPLRYWPLFHAFFVRTAQMKMLKIRSPKFESVTLARFWNEV